VLDHASKAAARLRAPKRTHRLRWLVVGSAVVAGGYGVLSRRTSAA
jgi:hypothetical protein